MLKKYSLGVVVLFMLVFTFSQILTTSATTLASGVAPKPTPAPSPTPGPPQPIQPFNGPYLDKPLSMEQAVQKAFNFDQRFAVWESPWNINTPINQGGRLQVQSFPNRGFDGSTYGPGQEDGPIWLVTIKGKVKMTGPGGDWRTHGSVSYIIAQTTGHFLGWRAGP
jgi:hypothetical protein